MSERPVLLTRPEPGLSRSAAYLRRHGVAVRTLPLLEIAPPRRRPPARLLADARRAAWLIFTSRPAVAALTDWLAPADTGARIAAIGAGTATALREQGWRVDLVPPQAQSESLLATSAMQRLGGRRVLIVGGAGGRRLLASRLRAAGARVDKLVVYRRRLVPCSAEALRRAIVGEPRVVFTSGAALRHFAALARRHRLPAARDLPLVVASRRLCKLAAELGFSQRPRVPAEMSDAALLATAKER